MAARGRQPHGLRSVCEDGRIFVREFRHIRAGDAIVCGRTESGEQGIYVHTTGFDPAPDGEGELADAGRHADNFAFRLGRSRETAFSASTTSSTSR